MRRGLGGSGKLFYSVVYRYHLVHMKREGTGLGNAAQDQNKLEHNRAINDVGGFYTERSR